jgi:nitroreductase
MIRNEMDTLDTIRKRRSIRHYTNDSVPKADLETIVDAGRLAATGSNRQPWDFIVVTDRAMIGQFKMAGAWLEEASAVVVVVMDPVSRWWAKDSAGVTGSRVCRCASPEHHHRYFASNWEAG